MRATSVYRDFNLLFLALLSFLILLFVGLRSCSGSDNFKAPTGEKSMTSPKPPMGGGGGTSPITVLALSKAPKYVQDVIKHIKSVKYFDPPKGFRGGRIFRNREGTLPKGKTYYEFDVHPMKPGVSRGAERLVVDHEKSVFYYTKDHYGTFVKIE